MLQLKAIPWNDQERVERTDGAGRISWFSVSAQVGRQLALAAIFRVLRIRTMFAASLIRMTAICDTTCWWGDSGVTAPRAGGQRTTERCARQCRSTQSLAVGVTYGCLVMMGVSKVSTQNKVKKAKI